MVANCTEVLEIIGDVRQNGRDDRRHDRHGGDGL